MERDMPRNPAPGPTIRLGVSSCLLGQEVRYDAGHSYEPFVAETLAAFFELVPVCPEAELGMGTPRETVDLVGSVDAPRMVGTHSLTDWTVRMNRWSGQRARQLGTDDICGYVFKRNSPSCGVFRVKVHPDQGRVRRQGRGLFAAEFARRYPLVPLEEEVRLHAPGVRDHFVVRVFALHRLQQIFAGRWRREDLITFHARETELLQTHDRSGLLRLDQLVAAMPRLRPAAFRLQYMSAFMGILARIATPAKHARVLQSLARYLKLHVTSGELRLLQARIQDYRQGHLPLQVPHALLRYYGELHGVDELCFPSYLNPDPREVMLRNHA